MRSRKAVGYAPSMTRPRTVLITNNTLDTRAGSEMYVRDLAKGLRKAGYSPVAFSTVLGEVAAELRLLTVPVTDDLSTISTPLDVIHGQHHLETMAALAQFPGVPAIYVCHGWLPWEEIPPRHPRIFRYVTVDETVRDRLLFEHGIPEERIDVIPNFVDLDRFSQRQDPLPQSPRRALIFNNDFGEGPVLEIIREACRARAISLDIRGATAGTPLTEPEHFLSRYDIVIARGRSAIEALAVGAAVILMTTEKSGPMVSSENLDDLRRMNFGIRTLNEPVTKEGILLQLDRYDAHDAEKVCRRIRDEAGSEAAIASLTRLYEDAIASNAGLTDSGADRRAVASYLQWLSGALKGRVVGMTYAPALLRRVHSLSAEVERLRMESGESGAHDGRSTEGTVALQEEVAELREKLRRAELDRADWERSLRGRAVGIVRRLLWR